jgi:dienelactone hydrolase
MKKSTQFIPTLLLSLLFACNSNQQAGSETGTTKMNIKEETVTYSADSANMNGFVAWDDADSAKRPVVLIVHEWWGLNDYVKGRARQLAKLGYVAMAVDMYGNGTIADNPEEAKKLAMPFYLNPQLAKQRFDAAMEKIKTNPAADVNRIAAIGYCFGGAVVLNVARLGEDLKGVVSFHGGLVGVPPDKDLLKAEVLVCHGDSDKSVTQEEVKQFSHEMDSIGAVYTVKHYANATHAFTNPASTENGKKFSMPIEYNAAADTASFKEMISFFERIFKQ